MKTLNKTTKLTLKTTLIAAIVVPMLLLSSCDKTPKKPEVNAKNCALENVVANAKIYNEVSKKAQDGKSYHGFIINCKEFLFENPYSEPAMNYSRAATYAYHGQKAEPIKPITTFALPKK